MDLNEIGSLIFKPTDFNEPLNRNCPRQALSRCDGKEIVVIILRADNHQPETTVIARPATYEMTWEDATGRNLIE